MAHDDARTDELFSLLFTGAFDSITATDELKAATLATIFAEMDAADAGEAGAAGDDAAVAPSLTVIDGERGGEATDDVPRPEAPDVDTTADAQVDGLLADLDELEATLVAAAPGSAERPAAAGGEATSEDAAAGPTEAAPKLSVVEGGRAATTRRRHGVRLRVAAAIVAVALTAGGVAYAVPASQVQVTEDGTTIRLGVNVFGMAVSVDADGEAGQELLEGLDVRNLRYEDALGRVIDRLDERGGDGALDVHVDGPLGAHREDLSDRAERVIADRDVLRSEARAGAPTAGTGASSAPTGGTGAPTGAMPTSGTATPNGATPTGGAPTGGGTPGGAGSGSSTDANQPTGTVPTGGYGKGDGGGTRGGAPSGTGTGSGSQGGGEAQSPAPGRSEDAGAGSGANEGADGSGSGEQGTGSDANRRLGATALRQGPTAGQNPTTGPSQVSQTQQQPTGSRGPAATGTTERAAPGDARGTQAPS